MAGDENDEAEDIVEVPAHCYHLLKQFDRFRVEQSLCDAVITCQEKSYLVHHLLLSASSPCFSKYLQSSDGKLIINLSHIEPEIVDIILRFIYTSKLRITENTVGEIRKICNELQLTHAVSACDDYQKNGKTQSTLNFPSHTEETESCVVGCREAGYFNEPDIDAAPVRKKRKIEPERVKLKKGNVSKRHKPVKKAVSDRKEAKKTTKKEIIKPKKSRKSVEPKKIKQEGIEPWSIPAKQTESLGENNSKLAAVNNENIPCEDINNKKCDTLIKIEREDGDVEVWKGENNKKIDIDDDDDDTDDYESNIVDENKEEGADLDSYKTVNDDGRVVKLKGKQKKKRKRKPFPCSMCSRSLTSRKRLIFHEYSKHGTPIDFTTINFTVAPCDVEGCNYVAADRRGLDMHMKSRHGEARPHVCEFCGKAFKLPNILAIHLNIHTGSKIWKCRDCGEQFNQQSGLQVHRKRYHMGETSWTEMCHMCSDKFLHKADLAWHLYKQHGQPLPDNYKMYTCDICGFSSMKYQQVKQHRERHDGIKNFVCPICQKGCSTKSELRRHVSFHGEKKYKCTFEGCSYACTDNIGLDKHIKLMHTHKDFKPYACPVCQYRTGVKGNVDKHIRTVHDLIVVTKHTLNLKMKYSGFDSGDVITKDGRLVASARERKALQVVPTLGKDIGMNLNTETVSSVNNLTYADYKVKETADMDYTNVKKSKRQIGNHLEVEDISTTDLLKPSIPTVVNDGGDSSKMENIIHDLPPLNNYVYIHGGDVSVPQDLRLQGVQGANPQSDTSLYTIGNSEMFGLQNKF